MRNRLSVGLGAVVFAVALAGCGGSPGNKHHLLCRRLPQRRLPPRPRVRDAMSSPATAGAEMKVASSSAGQIVVDSKGMSLYFFTKDVKDSGTSACTGACLTAWPVFTTTSDEPTVEGVTGTVGTIATPDGKKQVTLNGMPLYYYAKDKAPGDVTGQGVKVSGTWSARVGK